MSYSNKLKAGDLFPYIEAFLLGEKRIDIGRPLGNATWQAVFVYRGQHCPVCTHFLNQLEHHYLDLLEIGISVLAVSADTKKQLESHLDRLIVSFPIAYGLTEAQLQQLGMYISDPRSDLETDHRFPEPGLFVVNEEGRLHVVDISNNPFSRPDLDTLTRGLKWIRDPENHYPIRGIVDLAGERV